MPEFLTVPEAAKLARASHWTVRAWLSQSKLSRYKAGGKTLIAKEELLRFIRPETRAEAAARNSKRELATAR